jgi:hypothetical protein
LKDGGGSLWPTSRAKDYGDNFDLESCDWLRKSSEQLYVLQVDRLPHQHFVGETL